MVVYFTRVGNTDFDEGIDAVSGASLLLADGELMGNTQLMAEMLHDILSCDVEAITLTGEKYPSSYAKTVTLVAVILSAGGSFACLYITLKLPMTISICWRYR